MTLRRRVRRFLITCGLLRPRFYVATGIERTAEADAAADLFRRAGWVQTYRWAAHGRVLDPARWRGTALLESAGVQTADLVVLLLPGAKGSHTELGQALAADVPVLLSADWELVYYPDGGTCIFYHHPRVKHILPEEPLERRARNWLAWAP